MAIQQPTAHICAYPADFAETVLMPGDPLRSKFIAENYLTSPKLINNIRNIQGYTGTYKGVKITTMASGMGMPSIGIYSYELYNFFDVKNIIRVGTAGALQEQVKVRDLIFALGACTNSNYGSQYGLPGAFAPVASWPLLKMGVDIAAARGSAYHVGSVLSSDLFYDDDPTALEKWRPMGVLAVEMEAAALYMNAARAGKNALALLTVSNHIITCQETTAEERESSFTEMIETALEIGAQMG